jgi:hypothetical protein
LGTSRPQSDRPDKGNQLTIEVMLAIDPAVVGEGQTTAIVAARLANLAGAMYSWAPEMNGAPARAGFKVQTQAAYDEFVTAALKIPGVSLAIVQ